MEPGFFRSFLAMCQREGVKKGGRVGKLTGLAVINVGFTVTPGEAWLAATAIAAQSVLTGRPVATGILHTLFDVHLTGLALKRSRECFTFTLTSTSFSYFEYKHTFLIDSMQLHSHTFPLSQMHTDIRVYLAILQDRHI